MARPPIAVCLVAAALSACAPLQWVDRKTGSPKGAEAALTDCRAIAWTEAQHTYWRQRHHLSVLHTSHAHLRHGFGLDYPAADYRYLTEFCMRSKGYSLVEAPPAN